MAEFKAKVPSTFNPIVKDYTDFADWQEEFSIFMTASNFFNDNVPLPTQHARLFNVAGADFMRFVKQRMTIENTTTVTEILNIIDAALKPKRFDLQNRGKLFEFKQGSSSAGKYLQDLRELYARSNYPEQIGKETLIRDLFVAGVTSIEAKRLLFQEDSDKLTIDRCVHLVSSFESVSIFNSSTVSDSTISEVPVVSAIQKRERSLSCTSQIRRCFGCGQQPAYHTRKQCPAYRVNCRSCGRVGHFAKVCQKSMVNTVATDNPTVEPTVNTLHVSSTVNMSNIKHS